MTASMLPHENNATVHDLVALDTGQEIDKIDTGQLLAFAEEADDTRLVVTFHEIHKIDLSENGGRDLITSTLKYFSLHLAVQDEHDDLQFHLDGLPLVASLVYEDGEPVEELSATHEPPLLAAAGESPPKVVIEGGVAVLRLRITVLSSLCNKRSFCVKVQSTARPELAVATAPVKTITKLNRGPRVTALAPTSTSALVERRAPLNQLEASATTPKGAKRGYHRALGEDFGGGHKSGAPVAELDCAAGCAQDGHTPLDDLWDEVASNGARLLELQAQQRQLFKELRDLKQVDATNAVAAAGAEGAA